MSDLFACLYLECHIFHYTRDTLISIRGDLLSCCPVQRQKILTCRESEEDLIALKVEMERNSCRNVFPKE